MTEEDVKPKRNVKAAKPETVIAQAVKAIEGALQGLEGPDAGKARTRLEQTQTHALAALKG